MLWGYCSFFCISLILHWIICSVKCNFVQTKTQNVSYESINHQRSQQRSPKANLPATRSYLKQVMPVTSLSFTRVLFKSISISVHLITFSHRFHWKHNNNSKTHVIAGNGVKVLINVCIEINLCLVWNQCTYHLQLIYIVFLNILYFCKCSLPLFQTLSWRSRSWCPVCCCQCHLWTSTEESKKLSFIGPYSLQVNEQFF